MLLYTSSVNDCHWYARHPISDDDVDKGADCEDVVGSDATSSYSAGDCSLPLKEDRTRLLSSETCGVFVGGAGAIGLLSGTI